VTGSRRTWPTLFGVAVLAAVAATGFLLLRPSAPSDRPARPYDHIFLLVEENAEAATILDNPQLPTLNELANRYGVATQYFGTTHPSEGNYVSMLGGDAYDIRDDDSYTKNAVDKPSLVDQLEEAGLSWKGYFQTQPSRAFGGECYPTDDVCLYASKHNGFLNFTSVHNSDAQKAKLVPDTELAVDLVSGAAPNFAFIAPDQCHDFHGVDGVCVGGQLQAQSDAYLRTIVDAILGSQLWSNGRTAIVITFDEGNSNLGCCGADPGGGQVVTVVIRRSSEEPIRDDTPYNHYALTATLQQAFDLGCHFRGVAVGRTCDAAAGVKPMARLFGLPPAS
jgi:phosphatidylinositol-3-phosphatase